VFGNKTTVRRPPVLGISTASGRGSQPQKSPQDFSEAVRLTPPPDSGESPSQRANSPLSSVRDAPQKLFGSYDRRYDVGSHTASYSK
jgi:hypothetical protein